MKVDQKTHLGNAREEQQMSNEESSKTEVKSPASKPKWADLFGMAPDFDSEQFGIETTKPAGEHHVGTLDLSGEGNRGEVASPISDEATDATAQRIHAFAYPGAPWDLLTEESRDWCRRNARAALEAAYPAIREQVAEEIAVAIEAKASDTSYCEAEEVTTHLLSAAQLAREIGGRDLDATAPGSAGGASGRTGLSASPSDPQAGKAGRSESGGFEG